MNFIHQTLPNLEPVGYLMRHNFMKHLFSQISICLFLITILASCEKEYDTNVNNIWTRGIINNEKTSTYLNQAILISWNNGKIEGEKNRITTITDLGRQTIESVDLNNIVIEKEGESFCIPQLAHLYFVHQVWESESRIQNHYGFFLITDILQNESGVIILSSEYTPVNWSWTGQ